MQGGHQLHVSFATSDRFRLKLDYAIGGARIAVVALPLATFVRANRAFWLSHAGSRAGALAGRWLQVPAASAKGLVAGLGPLAPASLARCLVENHGTMSQAGRATVEGRPAILLRDAGDAPGSSPSVLAVAAHGKPYPLRYVSTGTQRAGGPIDVCNDGKASSSHGELRFGSFNAVRTIRRPKNYARLRSGASA